MIIINSPLRLLHKIERMKKPGASFHQDDLLNVTSMEEIIKASFEERIIHECKLMKDP